jgi:uncharacterized protein (TIGR01777 family)
MSDRPRLRLAVTGASGLIGSALVRQFRGQGYQVTCLVRRRAGEGEISWDPIGGQLDPAQLEGVDGVIHLAGENVGARWTRARKQRILESRVKGTRLLSDTLARLSPPPQVLVSVSAIGIYGNRGDEILTEGSPPGNPARDFLASVCLQWEAAAGVARAAGIRVVHPRLGVVLSPAGGALTKLLLPFRLGLGGRLGGGSQWMSWISLVDVVHVLRHCLLQEKLEGPVNVTAPEPISNAEFTRILARVLRRPAILPVPAAVLRLTLGEMAQTILGSTRALPVKLLQSRYRFQQSNLEEALRQMLSQGRGDTFPS